MVLQEFQRDSDELLLWMEEKFKVAEDESYRDPTNILRKLKKHEAAEKEMQANQVWLDKLVQVNCRSLVPSPMRRRVLQLLDFTDLPHYVISWGRRWLMKSTTTVRASRRSPLSSAAAGVGFRTRWPTEETN